jgi:hypothetical protein
MKLIIAGSRDYYRSEFALDHKELMFSVLDKVVPVMLGHVSEIVSGGAVGPDQWGEEWAQTRDESIAIKRFEPNWNLHGKAAGPMRNTDMVKYGDALVAFFNGKSRGTHDTIKKAVAKKMVPILVVDITVPF